MLRFNQGVSTHSLIMWLNQIKQNMKGSLEENSVIRIIYISMLLYRVGGIEEHCFGGW